MKRIALLAFIPAFLVPAVAFAAEAAEVSLPVARTGKSAAVVGLGAFLLTQLQKSSSFGAWIQSVPRRWRILVPIVLSGAGTVLAQWMTGMNWSDAAVTALHAAAASVFAGELFSQVTGQRTGDAAKPAAEPPHVQQG